MLRLLVALIAFASAPVAAGQTAVYTGPEGKKLTLEINDDGVTRIDAGVAGQFGIHRDGALYLVDTTGPKPRVATIADIAAAFDTLLGPAFQQLFEAAAAQSPQTKLTITDGGRRTVNGREGTLYRISGLTGADPAKPAEWVVSKDPALAPVGRAFGAFLESGVVLARPFIGRESASIVADMRAAFALGTPLDVPGSFTLASVNPTKFAPERFALPAAPTPRAEIIEEMRVGITALQEQQQQLQKQQDPQAAPK